MRTLPTGTAPTPPDAYIPDQEDQETPTSPEAAGAHAEGSALRRLRPHVALAAIAVLAGILDCWNLSINGWGNEGYAAAVRGMLMSWHNFRYAAADPIGLVTVDKPPLAFWIQAASATLFGFNSVALLAPSALAGALSVAVLGRTVTRLFGTWAGLIAALTLALTPVALAANRSNNTDAIMVLFVVLGTWAGVRAIESGRWRWVALVAVFFGLGFLTKMLAAFLVLPGLVLAYLVLGPRTLPVRLAQLLGAGAILAVICFGWMLSVDLTPASARPWVGSTTNNSEISLAFGYNGLERIFGLGGGPSGSNGGHVVHLAGGITLITGGGSAPANDKGNEIVGGAAPSGGTGTALIGGGGAGAAAGIAFGGPAGVTRLLTGLLAAQGSWLLPLALAGLVSALAAVGWRTRDIRLAGLIVFAGWAVVVWAVFSFSSGIFHPYYLSELAPGVAALVGIGAVALWRDARSRGWRALLPAIALAGTGIFEWSILRSTSALTGWGVALVAISAALALLLMAWSLVARRMPLSPGSAGVSPAGGTQKIPGIRLQVSRPPFALATAGLSVGLAALLVAPAAFAAQVIATAQGQIPIAQAPGTSQESPQSPSGAEGYDAGELLAFLERHAGHAAYLLASNGDIASLVIESGKKIVPLGAGSGGGSPARQELAEWVEQGQLRYFLIQSGGPFGGASALTADVTKLCTVVPASEWGGNRGRVNAGMGGGVTETLYDCAGEGSQL